MSKLKVRRLGYALGAEITGVDLTKPVDDETLAEIRKIWLENIVICIPGQKLEPDQMSRFCKRFGPLFESPLLDRHPEYPEITMIVNKSFVFNGKPVQGGIAEEWHTDQSFTVRPPSASFLNAHQIPDIGGETMFANMYVAYETLSPAMRRLVEPLEGVFDVTVSPFFAKRPPDRQAEFRERHPPVAHPLVRVHPETGRKSLYLCNRLRSFAGMTEEESRPLRTFLMQHATRYEFIYRHRWHLYDWLMWDNRCAMHYAIPDYDRTQLRRMYRCELVGQSTGYVYGSPEAVPA